MRIVACGKGRTNLVTRQEFLRRSPVTAEKMLRALIDAEAFADKHPQQAQQIIAASRSTLDSGLRRNDD